MNKYILLFIFLISTYRCGYLPLKKSNGFDDNVCAYSFNDVNYVKTCKDGKFCKDIGESTSLCEDVPTKLNLKTLDESCNSEYECEDNLHCYAGKCTMSSSSLINCATGSEPHKTQNGWICKIKSLEDLCYYKDDNTYSGGVPYASDYFKVCGKISFKTTTLLNNKGTKYEVIKIESAYIGTVEDGEFVLNSRACKSGYALPFYPDKTLNDPSVDGINQMFLKCVTVNDIDYVSSSVCTIKYDTDNIYNIRQINNHLYSGSVNLNCDKFLMTKLEIFSKYIGVFTEDKQKECAKKENYNEPLTCNEDELRKWAYYYTKPEHYILYYNEDGNDVANYLIQQYFPLYQSSKFLNIKYFTGLLFLLLI